MLKRKIRLNFETRTTLLLKTIQKLKNKNYGQKQDEEECREGDGSDEDGLPIYTFQVAGDYNIIRGVNTYLCGDTGLQISGTSTEPYEKWPSYNLIENCTSYGNCDPAENNADGFAAKLTCGDGNVFRGCIAYSNIDDGWDLFAKAESGPIGVVVIENSIAYKNGSLLDGSGNGDGNGFKLGGGGVGSAHVITNSMAFSNKACKAKGSISCNLGLCLKKRSLKQKATDF